MIDDEKAVAIIPARGGSKGIPHKNIVPIAGKPLIGWTIEQAINTESISHTFVSTNDSDIAAISKKFGAEVIWRPDELSTDVATSESAILHALDWIEHDKKITPQAVVFLQATSPLRKQDDIQRAISVFKNKQADSLISGSLIEDFLIWEMRNGIWESVNFDYKNRGRRQDRNPQFVENGSIYIFKPEIIREYGNRIGKKMELYEMDFWQVWEIDNTDDIPLVEFYLNTKIKPFEIGKLRRSQVDLIVSDFDGVITDNKVLTLQDGTEAILANRSDGLGIRIIKQMQIPMIILSTETNPVVRARAEKVGLPVIQAVENKKSVLTDYCRNHGYNPENVVYVGNDINDLEVMQLVGWPMCPADSHVKIKNISRIILSKKGGEGVIRELSELLTV
ncbi:acylneuraminate cytidylyltransferase [candidate division KSB1 bacterium]|nr:acylneuraminate cytidylyltransferase [candidate division KSB1 bacterium]